MSTQAGGTLSGQTVLVTGAARRLGEAIARRLHQEGANLAIHYRRSGTEAQALTAQLNALRPRSAAAFACDLREVGLLPGLVAETIATFGRLDVLVNNASSFYPTPVGEITPEQFEDLVATNLRAPLFLAQAAAHELRLRRGLVLNLIDIHGIKPLKRHPVYSATKAGLLMLTQSLARELGPEVRVNGIAPGPILWPDGAMDGDLKARIIARTILKRIGSPDDIARAALFFVRDAPYVTGQVLPVDGGRTAGGL